MLQLEFFDPPVQIAGQKILNTIPTDRGEKGTRAEPVLKTKTKTGTLFVPVGSAGS
jgi:hypothetical protein